MAGEIDNMLGGSPNHRALSAILFISTATAVLDGSQRFAPNPYDCEGMGDDPDKQHAALYYVNHSIAVTGFYSIAGALISRNPYPILGWLLASLYTRWLYRDALSRAQTHSTGWSS